MGSQLDPQHLLALMSHEIGINQNHLDHQSKIEGATFIGRIVNNDEDNSRALPILNGLASICVSDASHQVVAFAIQLNLLDNQMQLTIAENRPVKDSIRDYLVKAWELVQDLGDEFNSQRMRGDRPGQWKEYKGKSPGMAAGVGINKQVAIFSPIYVYT